MMSRSAATDGGRACRKRGASVSLLPLVLLAVLAGSGCASLVPQTIALRETWPEGVARQVELHETPFHPQLEFECGPAALATVLETAGATVAPQEISGAVYLPSRQGSLQADMLAAARRYGKVPYQLAPRFGDLLREVAAGNPVLVLQDTGIGPFTNWHYAVVIGYDYSAGELYLRSGETRRLAVPFTVFEYTWRKSSYWAMVVSPPERLPASASEARYFGAIAAMDRVAAPAASIAAYSTFLRHWPASIAASVALANRYYALGRLSDAEAVLRRASLVHPDEVVLLNNLAQVLSDLGRNDEARGLIEWALVQAEGVYTGTARETRATILSRQAQSAP